MLHVCIVAPSSIADHQDAAAAAGRPEEDAPARTQDPGAAERHRLPPGALPPPRPRDVGNLRPQPTGGAPWRRDVGGHPTAVQRGVRGTDGLWDERRGGVAAVRAAVLQRGELRRIHHGR